MTWLLRNLYWAWVPIGVLIFVVGVLVVRCQNAAVDSEVETPVASLTVEEISSEYRENEVRADSKYHGRLINLSGTIRDFRTGPLGGIHVELGPVLGGATVEFNKAQQAAVAAKSKGDLISVNGKCAGHVLGRVVLRDATLEN